MGQDLYDGRAPGVGSLRTAAYRQVSLKDEKYLPGVHIIDGSLSRDTGATPVTEIRAGMPMARIISSGKLRPAIIGVTTAAVSAGATTSLTVGAAVATEVARLITVAGGNVNLNIHGPATAGAAVSTQPIVATAASGTTITITSIALLNYISGSLITPAVTVSGTAVNTLFVTVMPNGCIMQIGMTSTGRRLPRGGSDRPFVTKLVGVIPAISSASARWSAVTGPLRITRIRDTSRCRCLSQSAPT